jgi:hypothetical protein
MDDICIARSQLNAKRKSKASKKRMMTKKPASSLSWFVDNGIIRPAESSGDSESNQGFDYLLHQDWESDTFPYTVLISNYKKQVKLYVCGRKKNGKYTVIHKKYRDDSNQELMIHERPTTFATMFINEYHNDRGFDRKNIRLTGFGYLKLRQFKPEWMKEPKTFVTLTNAEKMIKQHMSLESKDISTSDETTIETSRDSVSIESDAYRPEVKIESRYTTSESISEEHVISDSYLRAIKIEPIESDDMVTDSTSYLFPEGWKDVEDFTQEDLSYMNDIIERKDEKIKHMIDNTCT